ncbi:MAG TPA: hypothetical protein VKI44_43115 [Acetobacteraceae bacterium]|nr:hypothetical protein [Acetobacteraceae bacterium]
MIFTAGSRERIVPHTARFRGRRHGLVARYGAVHTVHKAAIRRPRSARDLFKRDKRDKPEHSIEIPKKTLILLPGVHSHALLWNLGKAGDQEGMQISGELQATNTSKFNIRAAGIRLLEPSEVEVLTYMVSVEDPNTGMHSYDISSESGLSVS